MRATRPLFWFCGGTPPPCPPPWGLCLPRSPVLPTPVGLGFASVLGPTRGGFPNAGYSPPLFVLWGDTPPCPPPWGLCLPGPPRFAHPRWLRGSPVFWAPLVAGLLMWAARPLFWFCGGTPPTPPPWGLCPPGPPLPTLVGLGFAGVLGPTRGGFANAGYSPPLLNLWGDTPPCPPPWGLCLPGPPLAHPRWLRVRRRVWSHS